MRLRLRLRLSAAKSQIWFLVSGFQSLEGACRLLKFANVINIVIDLAIPYLCQMQKLPIGIQDFRTLREGGYKYIDKTEAIFRLMRGKNYFLSRPRRFGKSLTLSTLKEIFSGSKELFKGLWIEDQWDWTKKHPVIHISFSYINYQSKGLEEALYQELSSIAESFGLSLKDDTLKSSFAILLRELSAKEGRIVLLIDEYDKPIIDYLDDLSQADENRDTLKSFYSVLKDSDPYLQMLFITGVSKFSKVSIFSDLNHLDDLTLDPNYADLTGYTQTEVEANFQDYIEKLSPQISNPSKTFLEQLKYWYNGYSWDGKTRMYNPFSVLSFFKKGTFQNFWFTTGTPSFLIKAIKDQRIRPESLEEKKVNLSFFDKFSLRNLDVFSLLFQTGYLTIKDIRPRGGTFQYTLAYPNQEVKNAFINNLFEEFAFKKPSEAADTVWDIEDTLTAGDVEGFISRLRALFADIAYHLLPVKVGKNQRPFAWEGYYQSVIYLLLRLLGVSVACEVFTNKGRIDAVVQTEVYVYLIEFKLIDPDFAMAQMKERQYFEKYLSVSQKVILLAIAFDPEERNIADWRIEEYKTSLK